ncbi:hypothetical protein SUGI_0910740 [Cryptomeria japonica]|nr:hypothetical protein SUGI_0910740 [Cryptomeria japonica]
MLLLLLHNRSVLVDLIVAAALGWLLLQFVAKRKRRECYLVDFTYYKPPAERQANTEFNIYLLGRTEPLIPGHLRF